MGRPQCLAGDTGMPHKGDVSSSDPCSSSTLVDPMCSSTLRARLRSQDPAPKASFGSSDSNGPGTEVYQRFRACFDVDPGCSNPQSKGIVGPEGDDSALAQLKDAFADAGLRFYTSVAQQIMQAHADIDSEIAGLSEELSTALSRANALYSNISYPLSATLCHGDKLPSATIATHLSKLGSQLSAAQGELRGLQEAWEVHAREGQQAWEELRKMDAEREDSLRDGADMTAHEIERFEEETERIVQENERLLDEVDAEFKQIFQGETMKIMQDMMAV